MVYPQGGLSAAFTLHQIHKEAVKINN